MSTEINTVVGIPATELEITIPMDGIEDLIQNKLDSDAFDAVADSVSDMISEEAWGAVEDAVDDLMRYNAWDYVSDMVVETIDDRNDSGMSVEDYIERVDEYRGIVERANNSDEVVDQPNLCGDGKSIYRAIHETVKHINARTVREDAYNSNDLTAEASEVAKAQTGSVEERIAALETELASLKNALVNSARNIVELEVQ